MDIALLPFLFTFKCFLELDGGRDSTETEDHVSELQAKLAPSHAINEQ